jgi:hypothetical protein
VRATVPGWPRPGAAQGPWQTSAMPALEPNPVGGNKKLLQMFALIGGIMIVISIVATIASTMG